MFANESHKTNSENLEVVKNVQDHEYYYYVVSLCQMRIIRFALFYVLLECCGLDLIYNFLHLLLLGSNYFMLITHVGYIWHRSAMNICLLKLQIRCVFEVILP